MKIKKNSILICLISLTFFYISCSTNNDETEELKSGIESVDNIEIKQSKIILGNENLMTAFDIESVDNKGIKQSKIILGNENLMTKFDTKPVDSIGIKQSKIILEQESFSQSGLILNQICGVVTGCDGLPVPGVNIQIKGTNTGTVTDIDGRYCISPITGRGSLVFSFLGYKTQEREYVVDPDFICPREVCQFTINITLECDDSI